MGLGFEMAGAIVLFMFVGHRVDRWLATGHLFLLTGSFLGIATAFYSFFRRVWPLIRQGGGGNAK
ncbi:MAG: AtpZ/AtpI family protein [bacterium]|nr:AtpZ/AtpI family protein [bacterium]